MAKIQKNLQLPDGVAAWFDEMERETGATHSRIALAAILQFTLSNDRASWMRYAVMVDKEELPFEQVPIKYWERQIAICEAMLKWGELPDAVKEDGTALSDEERTKHQARAKQQLAEAKKKLYDAEVDAERLRQLSSE